MKKHTSRHTGPRKPVTFAESPPNKSKAECLRITPTVAAQWLKKNKNNRPCSASEVGRLANEIATGRWVLNGETIKRDVNGDIRDGQKRLMSIIQSGISVWSWVIFDLPPEMETFDTIDQGQVRKLGQLLAIRGYKNYTALAAAIGIIYRLDRDLAFPSGGRLVWRTGLEILERHPGLVQSLDFVARQGIRDVTTISSAAALHYLMSQKNAELADQFWDAIESSVIPNKRSPIKLVRDNMLSNKMASRNKQLPPRTMQAITIKGWILLRQGKTRSRLSWNPEREDFPEII